MDFILSSLLNDTETATIDLPALQRVGLYWHPSPPKSVSTSSVFLYLFDDAILASLNRWIRRRSGFSRSS